jgi:hypothetical protein
VTHVEIVPTEFLHIRGYCETMRDRERKTFEQLGWDVEKRLTHEVAASLFCYTGLADGQTVLIYGARCDTIFADEAYVWMVGTKLMERYPLTIARHSRAAIGLLRENFRRIHGLVLGEFECSIRWLRWCGFDVDPPENGVCRFRMT